jgi:putative ABC transport system permease protein
MILRANLTEAARSLLSSKQRTILALIGIVIGIGSVIAMVSVGKIVQEESLRQFREMGTDILTIEKDMGGGADSKPGGGAPGPGAALRLADILAIPGACPGIDTVAPMARGGGEISFNGKKLEQASALGVTESFLGINKLKIGQGRFLTDMDEQSRYCVIGNAVANQMPQLGGGQPIGGKIRIGDNLFTVIGVLKPVPEGGMRRFEPNTSILIHITTGMRAFVNAEIGSVTAHVRTGVSNKTAGEQVKAHFTAKAKGLSVRVTSPEEVVAQMEKQMQMFTLLLGAIGSISLIVGGVGVMNVMLVSVTERRREIGIRRALGAKRGDIRGQFLIESVILSLVGGLLGILFGVGASRIIAHFAHWQFALSTSAILLGVGVSNAVGVFFGYYPARQASLLDPIVALKSD